jgi:hypothetical protein
MPVCIIITHLLLEKYEADRIMEIAFQAAFICHASRRGWLVNMSSTNVSRSEPREMSLGSEPVEEEGKLFCSGCLHVELILCRCG